jgi:ADP-ribose pyrophosphatase YjhB (NUDIX family)
MSICPALVSGLIRVTGWYKNTAFHWYDWILQYNNRYGWPMEPIIPPIRNAARALILQDNNILLLRKDGYEQGERYALPGGGQDLGETLEQALTRECMEEIDTRVEIRDLVYVADYFKPRDTSPKSMRHLVEFLFVCAVPGDYAPRNGHHPDKHQVEVVWASLDELADMPLYPRSLIPYLAGSRESAGTVYLGTIDW